MNSAFAKSFGTAVVVWLFLLVAGTIRTLFSLPQDGTARGLLGVAVDVTTKGGELETTFAPTPHVAIGFVAVAAAWIVGMRILGIGRAGFRDAK